MRPFKKKIDLNNSNDSLFSLKSSFSSLNLAGLPDQPKNSIAEKEERPAQKTPCKKRVELRRETGGRGGKTVTTLKGLEDLPMQEKEVLFKKLQSYCSTGGAMKLDEWVFQGDQREKLSQKLSAEGYRVILAGG